MSAQALTTDITPATTTTPLTPTAHLYDDQHTVPDTVKAARGKLTHELSTYSLPFDIAVKRREEATYEDCMRLRAVWENNKAINDSMDTYNTLMSKPKRFTPITNNSILDRTIHLYEEFVAKHSVNVSTGKQVTFDSVKDVKQVSKAEHSIDDTGASTSISN